METLPDLEWGFVLHKLLKCEAGSPAQQQELMALVVRLLCKAVGQGVKSAQQLLFRMCQEPFLIRYRLSGAPELWCAPGACSSA